MDLKPCPFCGSTKLDVSNKSVARNYGTMRCYHVAVYCKDCNTYGPRVLTEKVKDNVYPMPFIDFEKAEAKAIEVWNKRAENEELKFVRGFIHDHGLEYALLSAWNRRVGEGEETK